MPRIAIPALFLVLSASACYRASQVVSSQAAADGTLHVTTCDVVHRGSLSYVDVKTCATATLAAPVHS